MCTGSVSDVGAASVLREFAIGFEELVDPFVGAQGAIVAFFYSESRREFSEEEVRVNWTDVNS